MRLKNFDIVSRIADQRREIAGTTPFPGVRLQEPAHIAEGEVTVRALYNQVIAGDVCQETLDLLLDSATTLHCSMERHIAGGGNFPVATYRRRTDLIGDALNLVEEEMSSATTVAYFGRFFRISAGLAIPFLGAVILGNVPALRPHLGDFLLIGFFVGVCAACIIAAMVYAKPSPDSHKEDDFS